MRRAVGPLLVAVGVLLLVLAPLLRWYVYERVAVTPLDQVSETVSTGSAVTVFDIASGRELSLDLTSTRRVVADVEASTDEVAVWDTGVTTEDEDGVVRNAYTERAAFDRHTAETVNGYDEAFNEEPVEHEGLVFKFPFGTEQQDYEFWDNTVLEAFPAAFTGTDEIDGLEVYVFEQEVPATTVAQLDVPGAFVGEPQESTVRVDRVYSNARTLWVEPRTGVIIKGQEEPRTVLRYQGQEAVTATEGTLAYTDETVAANVEEYSDKASQLTLLRTTLPLVALVLGLVALVTGVLLLLRDRRTPSRHGAGRRSDEALDEPAPTTDPVDDQHLSVMRRDDGS